MANLKPFLFVGSVTPLDAPTEHYYVWFTDTTMMVMVHVRGRASAFLHTMGYTATAAIVTSQRRCATAFHLAVQSGSCRWPVTCPCGDCFSMPQADMSPFARVCHRCSRVAYPVPSHTLVERRGHSSYTQVPVAVGPPGEPSGRPNPARAPADDGDDDLAPVIHDDASDDDPDYRSDSGPVKRERSDSPCTDSSTSDLSEESDSGGPDSHPAVTGEAKRALALCTTPPRPTQPVNLRPKKRMRCLCRS